MSTTKLGDPVVDYASTKTPPDYRCGGCGREGCALMRPYPPTVPEKLYCIGCATEAIRKPSADQSADEDGNDRDVSDTRPPRERMVIPAIPVPDNSGYWPLMTAPPEAYRWWRGLSSRAGE